MLEFHISRLARTRYQFDQTLFSIRGNVIFSNFHSVRLFTQKMNQKKDLVNFPEHAVKAGQINALGLIDEILHFVIQLYQNQKDPESINNALLWVENRIGKEEVDKALIMFCDEFPTSPVYKNEISAEIYLQGETDGKSNRAIALEEMILLWVSNKNPAYQPYNELINDQSLAHNSVYIKILREVNVFFENQSHFGPDDQNLIAMLRSPAIAVPYSLSGQLDYIRTRWGSLLGRFLYLLLISLDMIKEEEKSPFLGSGPAHIPDFLELEGEVEQFSLDQEWMPSLVLLAKNAYVWLDQLSKKYGFPISHLDQIPNEELDLLARWGISGLWLIGVWERSQASARIKQLCGNAEAIASAYSLYAYQVASDLGGESALANLSLRAWQRGIRLASDMVPNHMGIDSPWVIDHPDWFISLDYSPFPSYTFNGPDLSADPRVSIQIEDHYYNKSDAAVVFKRTDRNSGQVLYIYHGNDGTSMPWNDTAQLNYLNPEVREAVLQTILSVAHRFPIIRFDAAMTLTKRHYQRLWFPEPGAGGDIPSRADHGLSHEKLNAALPIEFWREVVDRAAREAPGTLLLAEAFWLMEGYFVRTLGMHRVYNSAFMNMMRNEDNAEYRAVMKNTLEFDPEILKRFVNFMNNPDERTAVDQFGKGGKYFGICTLMSTLPGLPMFGHGQVEGFTEKYGMEFRKAYWDEKVDPGLVDRHEKEIFPLLHNRYLFAGVENFLLFDFETDSGAVNEDVYAYSNGVGTSRALVIYHNKFASTRGWIKRSVGFLGHNPFQDQRTIIQRSLGEGLNLSLNENQFVIFHDQLSNLEFIRKVKEIFEKGLFVALDAYQCHVFMDIRTVEDDSFQSYGRLSEYLNGVGVPSIQEALLEFLLLPVQTPFQLIANSGYFSYLLKTALEIDGQKLPLGSLEEAENKFSDLLKGMEYLHSRYIDIPPLATEIRVKLDIILHFPVLSTRFSISGLKSYQNALIQLQNGLTANTSEKLLILLGWLFTHNIGKAETDLDNDNLSRSFFEEWHLRKILINCFNDLGKDPRTAGQMVQVIRLLISNQHWYKKCADLPIRDIAEYWLSQEEIQSFININRHKGILWFNKESFEELLWWMSVVQAIEVLSMGKSSANEWVESILSVAEITKQLHQAQENSDYQVNRLLENLKSE